MGCLKEVSIVPKLGLSPVEVAEAIGASRDTVLRSIKRPATDPLHLPAYRINERDYRIYYQDLVDWIKRNYVGTHIRFDR